MKKKWLSILLIVFIMALVANLYIMVNYTGKFLTIKATEGELSLSIIGSCGDSNCDVGECDSGCAADCTILDCCGDGTCQSTFAEDCSTCPLDCGSCSSEEPVSGGGTSGGGAVKTAERDFEIDKDIIKVLVKQGETFTAPLTIKNTEKVSQGFQIVKSESIGNLISISEENFNLFAGEEKIIYLTFVSTNETLPEVYTGTVSIKTASKTKQVKVTYSVKSAMLLFDVSLHIPSDYKEIYAGEDVLLQLTIFNLGEVGETNVSTQYSIKDFEGNVIFEQEETISVETQVSFSKTITTPLNSASGEYVAVIMVRYDSSVGNANDIFHILSEPEPEMYSLIKNKYFIIIFMIVLFLIIFVVFLEHERKKTKDIIQIQKKELFDINKKITKKKIVQRDAVKFDGKLQKKLSALEKARNAGYITQSSYEKGKIRIKNLSGKIKKKCL